MAEQTTSWIDRDRAESFGAEADRYDAVRPRYPAPTVEAVLAGLPPAPPAGDRVRVLDVGTGTGILARALQAAGAHVEGNELDPGMAAVARRHGLTVHPGRFEDLDLPERFDRITAGQSWHWVEPGAGLAAARRLLGPGGQLWLLWNMGEPVPAARAVLDRVYAADAARRGVPSVLTAHARDAADAYRDDLAATSGGEVRVHDVTWEQTYTTAQWVDLMATHSNHAVLRAADRERLFAELAAALDAHGATVPVAYTTRAVVVSGLTG